MGHGPLRRRRSVAAPSLGVAITVAAILSACSNNASAEATPAVLTSAAPTASPSPRPSPSPQPEADVVIVDQYLLVPETNDFGLLGYQIVARIENRGAAWAKLNPFETDFVVLNAGGGVTSTGTMSTAYPQYLGPGETGYLVTYDVEEGLDPSEFVTVQITPSFEVVVGPAVTFEVTDVQVRYDGSYGLDATGFVTSSESREFAEVGIICIAADGAVRGVANAQMSDLLAGVAKAFQTTGPPTQVQAGECATTVASATAHDF